MSRPTLGGPARQGRQPQHHRGAEGHHDTGQRVGTPPQQHRRESDRHDRRERPPGDVVPEDSLEQRRHHQHPDQHPVARHPFGSVGCAGLGPQRAQGVGDHPPSLGTAEASGTDRKNETPLLPTAEAGPASTPMRPGRRSASVEPPGGEAGPSSKEKIHVTVAVPLGTLVGHPPLDRHRSLGAPLGPGRRRLGRFREAVGRLDGGARDRLPGRRRPAGGRRQRRRRAHGVRRGDAEPGR